MKRISYKCLCVQWLLCRITHRAWLLSSFIGSHGSRCRWKSVHLSRVLFCRPFGLIPAKMLLQFVNGIVSAEKKGNVNAMNEWWSCWMAHRSDLNRENRRHRRRYRLVLARSTVAMPAPLPECYYCWDCLHRVRPVEGIFCSVRCWIFQVISNIHVMRVAYMLSLAVSVHERFGLCLFSGFPVAVVCRSECVQLFCKHTWRRECINFYDSILHLRFFPFAANARRCRQPKARSGANQINLSHTHTHTEQIKTLSLDNFVCASDYIRTAYECCVCVCL